MPIANTIIRARSEHEAMELSLVLVSQGIETTIDRVEGEGWLLWVNEAEHGRAVAAIRQYRTENRRGAWRSELKWTGLLFDWRAIFVWVIVASIYLFGQMRSSLFEVAGVMDAAAVRHGEWWRIFSAMSLHADLPHLAAHMSDHIASRIHAQQHQQEKTSKDSAPEQVRTSIRFLTE